jgi:hypothetical protein
MKEKFVRNILEFAFNVRYWFLFLLLIGLTWLTYHVYQLPNTQIKDVVTVFAGGAVVITIFYLFLNYEYTQRKFRHDIQSARDSHSFNIAMEWQKEYMMKCIMKVDDFYEKNKTLLEDGKNREFHDELVKPENNETYYALMTQVNFFESVSLAVKQSIMDEDFIKGFFRSIFISEYNKYKNYIDFRRQVKHNPKIWCNFTTLSEKWLSCM